MTGRVFPLTSLHVIASEAKAIQGHGNEALLASSLARLAEQKKVRALPPGPFIA
jgi:hypothetical protein